MNDTVDSSPTEPPARRQRGPKRRTSFLLGALVGIVLGVVGTVTVPGLFPEGEPDCTRPDQVTWSRSDAGGVTLEVAFDEETGDGCDANIVFSERPRP